MPSRREQLYPPFLDLEPPYRDPPQARVTILPCPYEATTSYRRGCVAGPSAILRASAQVETFDEELGSEPFRMGLRTRVPPPYERMAFPEMAGELRRAVSEVLASGGTPFVLGGEHAITPVAVEAVAAHCQGLEAIVLDAHADLREAYDGTPFSHACALRRTSERVRVRSLGVRALSREESEFARQEGISLVGAREILEHRGRLEREVLAPLLGGTAPLYLSVDLDVFDPTAAPGVGTPVPGGLDWYLVLEALAAIFRLRPVVAMDLVELCPERGRPVSEFLAARLAHKMLAYLQRRLQASGGA